MSSKTKCCYVVWFEGKKYYVCLGHLDEFSALHYGDGADMVIENSFRWVKFSHEYEWYTRV